MPTSAFFDDQDALADVGIRAPGCVHRIRSLAIFGSTGMGRKRATLFVVQLPAGTASVKLPADP